MNFQKFFTESPQGIIATSSISLIGSLVSILTAKWSLSLLGLLAGMAVLPLTAYISYYKGTKRKFELIAARHPALLSSIDLLQAHSDNNSGIKIHKLVKNVYYDKDCPISHVTYYISGKILSQNKEALQLVIAGASTVDNLNKVKYYFSNSLGVDSNKHYIELTKQEITKLCINEYTPKELATLKNAILFELPFSKVLSKNSSFEIYFSYAWEKAITDKTDSTTYLCDLMFSAGVNELQTRLTLHNKPFKVNVKIIDYKKRKMFYPLDLHGIDIKNTNNISEISYKKSNPRDVMIIERTI